MRLAGFWPAGELNTARVYSTDRSMKRVCTDIHDSRGCLTRNDPPTPRLTRAVGACRERALTDVGVCAALLGCSNNTSTLSSCGAEDRLNETAVRYQNNPLLVERWARKFVWVGVQRDCIEDNDKSRAFMADMTPEERDKHIVR